MNRTLTAGLVTVGLVLWAHRLDTIGGRVPMVFVGLWFGSATIVALVFAMTNVASLAATSRPPLWRNRMQVAALYLLPLTLVPLLERRGVADDPAIWLLDGALVISLCSVPYFTLVARTVVGGVALSIGAFQALWTCGASLLFVFMGHLERARGMPLPPGATFEDFFRLDYRYLFYLLTALMLLAYCPALLWLGRRRFLQQEALPDFRWCLPARDEKRGATE